MIDGEIYALRNDAKCVFAYCERGSCLTSFYIGVWKNIFPKQAYKT